MSERTQDETVVLVAEAFDFACRHHTNQRRKGRREDPYVNHLAEVARLVARGTAGRDPVLVAAALLHDVVEDTDVTAAEIEQAFGEDVARLVMEVTDDQSLPQAQRRERQMEQAARISPRARIIRIADKISNMTDLSQSPASEWPDETVKAYFNWAREVVDRCRGVCPRLEAEFDTTYGEGLVRLKRRAS